MREKHQDWEALLERALAEECSAPANLLELVRNENGAAGLTSWAWPVAVCASVDVVLLYTFVLV